MLSFNQFFRINEKAPPGKKTEEWIEDNKAEFKERYGDEWEKILYATAWKMFGESIPVVEQSTSASTMTSGVENPDSPPLFKKSKFMGHECIEVDEDTYSECMQGKMPFKRWKKYVGDESLRSEMKRMYYKNNRMLIKNSKTGSMVFVK